MQLSLLALNALESEGKLRAHLETCPGCREYLDEISAVCQEHADAAQSMPMALASESFYRRLRQRIQREPRRPAYIIALDFIRQRVLPRYVSWATMAVMAGIGVMLWMNHRSSVLPQHGTIARRGEPSGMASLPPTLSRYHAVANSSLDALDDLLTRESSHSQPAKTAPPFFVLRQAEIDNL